MYVVCLIQFKIIHYNWDISKNCSTFSISSYVGSNLYVYILVNYYHDETFCVKFLFCMYVQ